MANTSAELSRAVEVSTSPFVLRGARDAMNSGLVHIEKQVQALEGAIADNPGLAIDLAKTLVESVCKAILSDRSITFDEGDNLPTLFKVVSRNLQFLPISESDATMTRKSLEQTLNGLSTAIHGICELRNQCGFASHGSAEKRPAMESVQALLAVEAADTIVGFLYRIHRQDRTPPLSPRTFYDENEAFNEYIDEAHGTIRILASDFRASEILFLMEPETYRIYATEFDEEADRIADNADALQEVSS